MTCSRCGHPNGTTVRLEVSRREPGPLCRRCRAVALWSPYVRLVHELERRSPPASAEECAATAAALAGFSEHLQRSLQPPHVPWEVADFVRRHRRPRRDNHAIGLAALVCAR